MSVKLYWSNDTGDVHIKETSDESNFGDILMPYILEKKGLNVVYKEKNPDLYGIGSLCNKIPEDYKGYVWSSGFLYPEKRLPISPVAVRGKLSLKQFDGDISNTVVGDGGLILDRIYKPQKKPIYTLGVMPHYTDNMKLRRFPIFQNPNILFISPTQDVETVVNQLCLCDCVVTSSLHGTVMCDTYGIKHAIFSSEDTNLAIHQYQDGFKFKDYYSAFDMEFEGPSFYFSDTTTTYDCLSNCKLIQKKNLETIKDNLINSLDYIINKIK